MVDRVPSILLVDDEPTNLFLLEELLQAEGYVTHSASSGAEALAIARTCHPDLILLDVMMPEMDGFEVCQQLRIDEHLQTIPIIFLTALTDDQSRLKGLEAMGDDYFTKPINHPLLLAKITNLLRLSQMREARMSPPTQPQEQLKQQAEAAWRVNEVLSEKFRLFVPDQLLSRIAPMGVESIQVGNATEEEVTVLFCDIRGFTAISESQAATETFDWLNAFFSHMHSVIEAHHGFVDKYLGDAVMAVFDRPQQQAQDALDAAVMMRQTLNDFNRDRAVFKLKEPIEVGIGIHTGQAIIGTLGSKHRMDSTVVGDAVNTAARLQELTKLYDCYILASDAVIDRLTEPEQFYCRWIDSVTPRGKQQQSQLYEVLGTTTIALDAAKLQLQPLFEQGIQQWTQGNPALALTSFQQVVEQNPLDTIAALYLKRCQASIQRQAHLTPFSGTQSSLEEPKSSFSLVDRSPSAKAWQPDPAVARFHSTALDAATAPKWRYRDALA